MLWWQRHKEPGGKGLGTYAPARLSAARRPDGCTAGRLSTATNIRVQAHITWRRCGARCCPLGDVCTALVVHDFTGEVARCGDPLAFPAEARRSIGSRCPGRTGRSSGPRVTLRARWSGRSGWSRGTDGACGAGRTCGPLRTRGTAQRDLGVALEAGALAGALLSVTWVSPLKQAPLSVVPVTTL